MSEELKQAVIYLRKFQDWRRGYDIRTMVEANIDNKQLGKAIDTILKHFGYSEPITDCRECKFNGERQGFVGCIKATGLDNRECKFERIEE